MGKSSSTKQQTTPSSTAFAKKTTGTTQLTLGMPATSNNPRNLWAGFPKMARPRQRRPATHDQLFAKWAELARHLGRLPSWREFHDYAGLETGPLLRRYQRWENVSSGFASFAKRAGLEKTWSDVLAMAEEEQKLDLARINPQCNPRLFKGRPLYGPPLRSPGLAHEPTNEAGVIFAFGMVAHELNFLVTRLQTQFPDCEALREIEPGIWQRVRIEFEYMSRNFLEHKHPADGCDIIVCWIHNWFGCPENIEVLELSPIVRNM